MSNDSGTNKKLKDSWRHWTADHAKQFLRTGPEGKRHLSRQTTLRLLDGMSSVLDVGCGTGVMFELIRDRQRELDYLGIDVTETFLDVARNLYPEDRQRFRRMSLYELPKLRPRHASFGSIRARAAATHNIHEAIDTMLFIKSFVGEIHAAAKPREAAKS
jgi:SAM-dependent methyltransferase